MEKEITQEQIDAWKAQHTHVFKITAKDRGLTAYCRSVKRQEMSYISSVKDPIKFNELLLNTCWLAGDEEIKTDDAIFMGLAPQISKLMHAEEVELEKL